MATPTSAAPICGFPSLQLHAPAMFVDKNSKGQIKLQIHGIRLLGDGELHRVKLMLSDKLELRKVMPLRYQTPKQPGAGSAISRIYCTDARGKLYLFIGQVQVLSMNFMFNVSGSPQNADVSTVLPLAASVTPTARVAQSIDTDQIASIGLVGEAETAQPVIANQQEKSTHGTKSAKAIRARNGEERAASLQQRIALLAQVRNSGMDPRLRMEEFSALAKESPATLYRKIKVGTCPSGHKRGRSSFWLLSEVELYMAGKWELPQDSKTLAG